MTLNNIISDSDYIFNIIDFFCFILKIIKMRIMDMGFNARPMPNYMTFGAVSSRFNLMRMKLFILVLHIANFIRLLAVFAIFLGKCFVTLSAIPDVSWDDLLDLLKLNAYFIQIVKLLEAKDAVFKHKIFEFWKIFGQKIFKIDIISKNGGLSLITFFDEHLLP